MGRPAALDVALALVDHPSTVRHASRLPLPSGIAVLLQVAAGETDALREAQNLTHRSQAALQAAAGFFIEQILFAQHADNYRILGGSSASPRSELRRHMALLSKWLHPDGQEQRAARTDLDRGIFIHRVTQAWETLKTEERRAAYDQSLAEKAARQPPPRPPRRNRPQHERAVRPETPQERAPEPHSKPAKQRAAPSEKPKPKTGSRSRLVVYRFERDTLLNRLLFYLQGRT
jgi:hypothetical protein